MEESNSIDFPMNRFPGGLPHQLGNILRLIFLVPMEGFEPTLYWT
jgi:hypothetical protein